MMKSQIYLMRDKESNQSYNKALRSRMVMDMYISENPEQTPECREE